jgi:hypothetical protein
VTIKEGFQTLIKRVGRYGITLWTLRKKGKLCAISKIRASMVGLQFPKRNQLEYQKEVSAELLSQQ